MGEPVMIGLDCSTHGAKAMAWDPQGQPLAQARAAVSLLNPQPGWYEQRARDWLEASVQVLRELGQQLGPRVAAIGITHQRETFVGVDAAGQPVRNAIVWMDERAYRQVHMLRALVGEDQFHRITGKPLAMTPSVTKMLWLREHEPDAYARVAHWLDVQGFLVKALTGELVTSAASAEPMGLVDLVAADWSDVLLQALDIPRGRLASLVPAGTVVGGLCPRLAQETGLAPGTPVVVSAGDGQVAALAAQVLNMRRAYLNLGTAIVSGTISAEYVVDRAFRTMMGAVDGTYLLESDLKGGTFTLDWLSERVLAGRVPLGVLEERAKGLPPGSAGLVLLPYFATVMNPYWDDNATGVMVGLRAEHGPEHVYRAILEGIALEQRLHLTEIERASNGCIEQVRVLGGGSCSDLWCQILADVLSRPVQRVKSLEATSLGAAMVAAAGVGLFGSPQEAAEAMSGGAQVFEPGANAARYDHLYAQVYVRIYPALRSVMGRLAQYVRLDECGGD